MYSYEPPGLGGHACMSDLSSTVYTFSNSNFVHNGIPLVPEMALASGHWVVKETGGMPPSPR